MKKNALKSDPRRARSFGWASSTTTISTEFEHTDNRKIQNGHSVDLPLIRLDPPTMAGVIPIPIMTRAAMNMPRFCDAVSEESSALVRG